MGTRAMYGFYKDGKTKGTYNHMDGYPSGLGENIAEFARTVPAEEMRQIFGRIELVQERTPPTALQKKRMMKFDETLEDNDFEGSDVWYSVLRQYMGDLFPYRDGLPFMTDGADFIKDSLFCEWAYVINLDDEVLEVYKGFQEKSDKNRYYDPSVETEEYKNCRLVATYPFSELTAGTLTTMEVLSEA